MIEPPNETGLSPLDQIRHTEAEVTRKIAAAREQAEQIVKDARSQAAAMQQEAEKAGSQQGQARYREVITRTEEESRALLAEAKAQARKLRLRGQQRMQTGVNLAKNFVVNQNEGEQEI